MLFTVVGYITRLAPIGALGAMAFTIGSQGLAALAPLAKLMLCFYATCLLFVFGVLGVIARLHGFSIFRLVHHLREELLIVLGTSSSESVLPRLMDKLEKLGCKRSVVGLVVPSGYSFNLDGTCIYLTMAAVFLAQATDTHMTLGQQLLMLGVLLLTSKGAAGVTGSGFVVLAGTLAAVDGPPLASLALILGIDRFMSEARALTNLVGNAVATLVVSKWTGAYSAPATHSTRRPPPSARVDQKNDLSNKLEFASHMLDAPGTTGARRVFPQTRRKHMMTRRRDRCTVPTSWTGYPVSWKGRKNSVHACPPGCARCETSLG